MRILHPMRYCVVDSVPIQKLPDPCEATETQSLDDLPPQFLRQNHRASRDTRPDTAPYGRGVVVGRGGKVGVMVPVSVTDGVSVGVPLGMVVMDGVGVGVAAVTLPLKMIAPFSSEIVSSRTSAANSSYGRSAAISARSIMARRTSSRVWLT